MNSTAGSDADRAGRVRQQQVVADLGRAALETDDGERLLYDVAASVAETFETEFAAVFESQPAGEVLRLRQGVGWRDGAVDDATIPTGTDSQAGFAVRSGAPVVVERHGGDIRVDSESGEGSTFPFTHPAVRER